MKRTFFTAISGVLVAGLAMSQGPPPRAGNGPPPGGGGPAQMKIERDIEYARVGSRGLKLDLYLREPASEPRPLVVWIHGGGWSKGDKFPTPAARLVADGYAVASVEYRLSDEVKWPGQLYDCKAAIRWLRANAAKYNLDAAHIAAWGNSSGGHLVALLGTTGDVKELEGEEGNLDQSSRVQAVVDFYGPIDLLRMDATATKPKSNAPDLAEAVMIGGPLLDNLAKVKAANPITYISKDDPPFLVVHGTADTIVPPQQGDIFVSALKAGGVDATIEFAMGAHHSIQEVLTPAMTEMVTTFFDKHLRGGKRVRGDVSALSVPFDSWEDPISEDYPGVPYKTYPTPARGPKTQASYRLYLPPDYETSKTRRYPVIYYLHGLNDSSRKALASGYVTRADAAIRAGIMPPAIIIMVQGLNRGWYVDSKDGKYPMESVIVKDLISHVDSKYRTIATRQGRAIEGHSMGGWGALHLGFKYPDLFGHVGSLSAALIPTEEFKSGMNLAMLRETFGGELANYDAEGPWTIVRNNASKIRGRTDIRMMVGDQDGLKTVNENFDSLLTKLDIAHQFSYSKGAPHAVKEVLARLDFNPFEFYGKAFAGLK